MKLGRVPNKRKEAFVMHKRKVRQVIALVATMVLILLNLCGVSLVENKEIAAGISAGETPLIPSEGGGEGEPLRRGIFNMEQRCFAA